jgi:hypothetical protein
MPISWGTEATTDKVAKTKVNSVLAKESGGITLLRSVLRAIRTVKNETTQRGK